MSKKNIPFYTEYKNTEQNYTLFLKKQSNRIFKAYHKKPNHFMYILAFIIILTVLRAVNSIYLPMKNPLFLIGLVLGAFGISIFIGMFTYRTFTYEEPQEMFYPQSTIDDFMIEGKKVLKTEVIVVAIISICSIILMIFFFIYKSLILLLFLIACFSMINVLIQRLPKERFNLQ